MSKKINYTPCKTADDVKSKYPLLMDDVVKIPLVGKFGKKEINTGMFGVYSPSVKEILMDCKDKIKLTSNFDFVTEVEHYVNQLGFEVNTICSLSKGGKQYADFDVSSKIKTPKELSLLNIRVNAFVIETNDTSFKMRVGAEVFFGEGASIIIQDKDLESVNRNLTAFTNRSEQIVDLTLLAISKVNLFLNDLVKLKDLELTSDKMDEFLRIHFKKSETDVARRTMFILDTITDNVRLISSKIGMNYLALLIGISNYLYVSAEDGGEAREVFLFRNGKVKSEQVLSSMYELLNKKTNKNNKKSLVD